MLFYRAAPRVVSSELLASQTQHGRNKTLTGTVPRATCHRAGSIIAILQGTQINYLHVVSFATTVSRKVLTPFGYGTL